MFIFNDVYTLLFDKEEIEFQEQNNICIKTKVYIRVFVLLVFVSLYFIFNTDTINTIGLIGVYFFIDNMMIAGYEETQLKNLKKTF